MSSTTSWSEFLSTPGLHWPSRILRLRRIGRPASWSVESWRVNVQSCLVEIFPMVNHFLLRPPPFLGAGFGTFLPPPFARSERLLTQNPFWPIPCCASFLV